MPKNCNKRCKFHKEDGWTEKYLCAHPSFPSGKIIFSIKTEVPSWCPRKKEKKMKIIILFLIFTSILLYSCKPKPNYAQVKSAFYNCIETKLLQKQYSNESEADMHEFSNIIDVCKVEVQK